MFTDKLSFDVHRNSEPLATSNSWQGNFINNVNVNNIVKEYASFGKNNECAKLRWNSYLLTFVPACKHKYIPEISKYWLFYETI